MERTPRTLAALALGAALVATAGCGKAAEKISETATEKAIESQTGGDVDIDASDGEVSIETEDGSMQIGSSDVPDGWPDDVYLPDDLVIVSSTAADTADGTVMSITATVDTMPEDLLAEYEAAMEGWEVSGQTTVNGGDGSLVSAQFERDGELVTLTATTDPEAGTGLYLAHTTTTS